MKKWNVYGEVKIRIAKPRDEGNLFSMIFHSVPSIVAYLFLLLGLFVIFIARLLWNLYCPQP